MNACVSLPTRICILCPAYFRQDYPLVLVIPPPLEQDHGRVNFNGQLAQLHLSPKLRRHGSYLMHKCAWIITFTFDLIACFLLWTIAISFANLRSRTNQPRPVLRTRCLPTDNWWQMYTKKKFTLRRVEKSPSWECQRKPWRCFLIACLMVETVKLMIFLCSWTGNTLRCRQSAPIMTSLRSGVPRMKVIRFHTLIFLWFYLRTR